MRGAPALVAVLGTACITAPLAAQQRHDVPDHDDPLRRQESFYERRAYPFAKIPAGALQRARHQLDEAAGSSLGLSAQPASINGTEWRSLGPQAVPIYGTSVGRVATVAVDPTNANVIYVGGAQGGVWKTVDGGTDWTPLTDQQCSLAMGSIAIDPVDPSILYAGTGEENFSGDSYYGCGVLRSVNGGATWTQLGASIFQTSAGGARISKLVIVPRTAGSVASTTVLAATTFGLYRSLDGGATWSATLAPTTGCTDASVGCSVTDVVLDPANDSVAFAGVGSRGVYRSTDRGATWTQLAGGLPTVSVGRVSLAATPAAPQVLYAGFESSRTYGLYGIWMTTDGGADWTRVSATNVSCGSQCWYDMPLAVSPTDPATVYFGGIQLYRSTDGGATFTNVSNPIHVDQHALVFDPQHPSRLYVGNDGGVYVSPDGGASWTSLNQGLALTQFYEGISIHPSNDMIVMGGTQDNGTVVYDGTVDWSEVLGVDGGYTAIDREYPSIRYGEMQWGSNYSGPRRSDLQYAQVVGGINLDDRAEFIPPLVMDPSNSDVLYFGTYRLYRTTDRGDLWAPISDDLTDGAARHGLTAIAPAPSNPATIYVGSHTGLVHVTRDTGTTWALRTNGLPLRYVQDLAVDPGDDATAYVAFSGFGSGHVFRTTDAGTTWTDVSGNLPDVPVNAVLTDPGTRANVMIGTDVGVFLSTDSGGTWQSLNRGLPHVAVYDLAYNPATGVLIAGTHGRGMFALTEGALTLAVRPRGHRDSLVIGSGPIADSAFVTLSGTGSYATTWAATTPASWISLRRSAGVGSGLIQWSRDPTGLVPGTYVAPITVAANGAANSPAVILDSLVMQSPVSLRLDADGPTAVSGDTTRTADSARVWLSGGHDTTSRWTATHDTLATWLTLVTPSGRGTGTLVWTRTARDLAPGAYLDTLAVITQYGDTGRVEAPFAVIAPYVNVPCAAQQLLGADCLDSTAVRYLDLAGNHDGRYTLGDLVAWFAPQLGLTDSAGAKSR